MLPRGLSVRPLTAFSPDGSTLAVATPDGRLKTFDAGSGRILLNLAEDGKPSAGRLLEEVTGHLFEQHNSLCWVAPNGGTADASIVLGTAAGDVKAYSAASGKLLWRATAVSEGGVAGLAAAAQARAVYAVGGSSQVVRLAADSGTVEAQFEAGRHSLSSVAVTADGSRAFVASSAVTAWDLAETRRVSKFTGHPSAVQSLAVTEDGQFAASVAAGERHVAVWQATEGASKKTRSASGILSLEDAVVSVSMRAAGADTSGAGFFVAALSEAAELYVWHCVPSGGEERRVAATLRARISIGASRAERGADDGILAAHLTSSLLQGNADVQIARSSWAQPSFQHVPVPAADSGGASQSASIVLPPKQGGILLPHEPRDAPRAEVAAMSAAAAAAPAARPEPFMLGPDNAGQAVQLQGRTAEGQAMLDEVAGQKRRRAEAEAAEAGGADSGQPLLPNGNAAAAATADFDSDEEEDSSDAEPTLGDRVAALQLEEQRRAGGGGEAEEEPEESSEQEPLEGIQADSLAVLLTQALRSEDKALLERCLTVGHGDVIRNTVARLQAPDAALFLRAGVARLQSKPARARQLAAWLQQLVLSHTAYLIAAPGAQSVLTALYQCIEARLTNQQAMVSLAGRLELLAAQAPGGGSAAPAKGFMVPQVVYLAGDSEGEDELQELGPGGAASGGSDGSEMSDEGIDSGEEGWGSEDEESRSDESDDDVME